MVAIPAVDPGTDLTLAFRNASRRTGVGFDYLMRTAMQESSLRPNAKASTSSAAGLFQFIESTWLRTLKTEGPRLGLEEAAAAIEPTGSGRFTVADRDTREQILNLRHDPEISALMAGAFTRENSQALSGYLGRSPSDGELYMAHFLGADGAGRLISMAEERPGVSAARAFPDAARANRSIFYERDGRARSIGDVYQVLNQKHISADAPARDLLGEPAPAARPTRIGSLFESLFRVFSGNTQPAAFTSYFTTTAADSAAPVDRATASSSSSVHTSSSSTRPSRPAYGPPVSTPAIASVAYARHAEWSVMDHGRDDPASMV